MKILMRFIKSSYAIKSAYRYSPNRSDCDEILSHLPN